MKNLQKVSIAMATYNGEKFIEEQIESLLNQTYVNIEIIICDDCSTDNTFQILQDYAKKDSRIKLFKNKRNLGYVKNFEKAISLCNGDYIALSDQDDIWLEKKIEILLKNIGNYDLIHSDAYLINENEKILNKSYSNFSKKQLNPKDIIELAFTPMVTGCTCMFTKDLKEKVLPFCNKIHIHDLWISLIAFKNNGIKYHGESLIKYRQHDNNQIGALKKEKKSFLKIVKLLINKEYSRKNSLNKELKKIYCIKKLNLSKYELNYLIDINKMFLFILSGKIKYLYYFFKIHNKLLLNKTFFEKNKIFFNTFVKIKLLNLKGQ